MSYRKYSRLKKVENRNARKSVLLYIALTLALIFLLFRLGLPALSALTSFLSGFDGEPSGFVSTAPPPPPPTINSIPSHTNQESIRITGTTRPGMTVMLFFNEQSSEVLSNAQGEFTTSFKLREGENTLYARVADSRGQQSTDTKIYTIVFDNKPPELTIVAPEDGASFFGSLQRAVRIEGTTEPQARVAVNNRVVVVGASGAFEYFTNLQEGENLFEIKAVDRAGNETKLEYKLNFSL